MGRKRNTSSCKVGLQKNREESRISSHFCAKLSNHVWRDHMSRKKDAITQNRTPPELAKI